MEAQKTGDTRSAFRCRLESVACRAPTNTRSNGWDSRASRSPTSLHGRPDRRLRRSHTVRQQRLATFAPTKQTPLIVHARSTPLWARSVQLLMGREFDGDESSAPRDLLGWRGSRSFVEHPSAKSKRRVVALDEVGLATDMLAEVLGPPDDSFDGPGVAA